jgi:hypothetical protein
MPKTIRREVKTVSTRFFKPRLHRDAVQQLHILHIWLLDDIARGRATEETLWELVAMAFTWSRTAEMLGLGEENMVPQLELATRLVERWGRTGRVEYVGDEYQVARIGTIVMDTLAERTDSQTAREASQWSEGALTMLKASKRRSEPSEVA